VARPFGNRVTSLRRLLDLYNNRVICAEFTLQLVAKSTSGFFKPKLSFGTWEARLCRIITVEYRVKLIGPFKKPSFKVIRNWKLVRIDIPNFTRRRLPQREALIVGRKSYDSQGTLPAGFAQGIKVRTAASADASYIDKIKERFKLLAICGRTKIGLYTFSKELVID
jgi:hypothetical protein